MKVTMNYRELNTNEINQELFRHFRRHQTIKQCLRKIDGKWFLVDVEFIEDWNEENYSELITCLKNTITTKGIVIGAFSDERLKGFVSVEPVLFGINTEYLDLSSIHVSEDMRGKGIGKELFQKGKSWAKEHGAQKLYISAHSALESQAFYQAMGCCEAEEYSQFHVKKEPYDCQLECKL